ncbi:hypothetical protein SAMN05216275_116133 [Streptosporangium canum]|uniref:WD40-like Beta Propeller Repeat n=1 Tax=Streptosporangium canum TaxID=324952 RepID=A0A1I3WJI0_9ACTN|nr:hypothetical protein [Streptosporangium canum]SFK06631.1 hypothetical protein SAMN05216275_116133 [Streptosporangium canum]
MSDFEDTLRTTLGRAAEHAPRLPGAVAGQLEIGYRRRRRRFQALLAAAAVVVVAGGAAVGLRAGGGGGAPPAVNPSGVHSVVVTLPEAAPEPIEKVWPQAVWKMSAKGADGRELWPVALIDDRTLLVKAWRTFEKTDVLYAYDLISRNLRKIADVPAPKGTVRFAADFSLGDGQVAWWTTTKGVTHIWAAALDGGEARLVADRRTEGDDVSPLDGLGVANGNVVFSLSAGGVFSVPLAGGPVTPVRAGAGLHLLSWPWAGSPGTGGPRGGPPFSELVNLETGQTSTAAVHQGEQVYACGVQSCTGMTADGRAFTRLRDGSQQKDIPVGYLIPEPPTQSRFHVRNIRSDGPGLGLYDLNTGTFADLGIREEAATRGEVPVADRSGRFMTYRLKNDRYVIDLSKIP